jgi:hypothetical protein
MVGGERAIAASDQFDCFGTRRWHAFILPTGAGKCEDPISVEAILHAADHHSSWGPSRAGHPLSRAVPHRHRLHDLPRKTIAQLSSAGLC